MTTAAPFDVEADRLASEADELFLKGEREEAAKRYAKAAEVTEEAVKQAAGPRARSLLMSNATLLWFKARKFDRAERLAYSYLLADGDATIGHSLREVLFHCWQDRSLPADEYVTLYEVHLLGGEVTWGMAPTEETAKREEGSQALLWRAAEHEAGLKLRPRGAPVPEIAKLAQLYTAVPSPGSFKLRFKVRAPWRQELLDTQAIPSDGKPEGGEPLVHRAVSLVRTIAHGTEDDLAEAVPDPVYRTGFMKLVREMAPDGKRIEQVDIGGGKTRWQSTSLTRSTRERIRKELPGVFEKAGWQSTRGKLVAIQMVRKGWLRISVKPDVGLIHHYEGPVQLMDELKIGELFNRSVVAAGKVERSPRTTRTLLEHVEREDDGPST